MGKGSLQRPFDRERYAANYERIFGKPKKVCSGDGSEYCEDCSYNPDVLEIQTRFFCPKKGEPMDG